MRRRCADPKPSRAEQLYVVARTTPVGAEKAAVESCWGPRAGSGAPACPACPAPDAADPVERPEGGGILRLHALLDTFAPALVAFVIDFCSRDCCSRYPVPALEYLSLSQHDGDAPPSAAQRPPTLYFCE